MSKITLTPNASGTGTFTVASPNSNTNRTLTLPDAEGNLVVNTGTGVDITGTLTSDGLTVDGDAAVAGTIGVTVDSGTIQTGKDSASSRSHLVMHNPNGVVAKWDTNGTDLLHYVTDEYKLYTAGNKAFEVDGNNDISFYEDTGTTPKFFWDASAESLGIGTISPSNTLHLSSTSPQIRLEDTNATGYSKISGSSANIYLQADEGNTVADSKIDFRVDGQQRMVIDSSGNLLVGTTASQSGLAKAAVQFDSASQYGLEIKDAGTGTTGTFSIFYRGSTDVGSIGVYDNDNIGFLSNVSNHGGIICGTASIVPALSGTYSDNATDVGTASSRWDDIYATNGTIQTSDRNEKQDIEALSDAEQRVAVACKGLLRKFRWIDAVAEKGDDARIHFGIIAQDLQDAFAAEGLDAGRYAMFISSTWWETQTEVPAVEAVEAVYEDVVIPAVLDEDGNEVEAERIEQQLVTEAVEAKEAYTRTDTYETLEEAPEGATERTRLGVRYPELLAFIIGAM